MNDLQIVRKKITTQFKIKSKITPVLYYDNALKDKHTLTVIEVLVPHSRAQQIWFQVSLKKKINERTKSPLLDNKNLLSASVGLQ